VLPNGAIRSPDAAWVSNSRLNTLTEEQKRMFIPLCPEFVVEAQSPSDSLPQLKHKMSGWIDNGAQPGWLIQADAKTVHIYRAGKHPEMRVGIPEIEGEGPERALFWI
jgi:Uma2 family endonuclease